MAFALMVVPVVNLSDRRDSNPRPSAWEANALPTELLSHKLLLRAYHILAGAHSSWKSAAKVGQEAEICKFMGEKVIFRIEKCVVLNEKTYLCPREDG